MLHSSRRMDACTVLLPRPQPSLDRAMRTPGALRRSPPSGTWVIWSHRISLVDLDTSEDEGALATN